MNMCKRPLHVGILVCLMLAATAWGQNNRSAVSLNGSDMNPCTTASPCRSFGTAMTHTNPGGDIIALDSAGYGPFTIDRSVTVSGAPGVHAAITVTVAIGILVSALDTDVVELRNLVLIGAGGNNGIEQDYSKELRVFDCLIHGFSNDIVTSEGVLTVEHSKILDCTSSGIVLVNTRAVIHHCLVTGTRFGIVVGPYASATVSNSALIDNGTAADVVSKFFVGAARAELVLESCVIAHNTNGVVSEASGGNSVARAFLSQNVVAYNSVAVSTIAAGTVSSFGNNRFVGNGIDVDGGPMGAVVLK
jgi:hypothetical protein